MTDPVRALEAVLRGIEERTKYECDVWCQTVQDASGFEDAITHSDACIKKHTARVRAEQARAVERMVEAAIRATSDDVSLPDVWTAALRAGEDQKETL